MIGWNAVGDRQAVRVEDLCLGAKKVEDAFGLEGQEATV
jgi:hypothetical protein